jgi:DNA-binding helix-hairpin-helix protein with protein kinase domain
MVLAVCQGEMAAPASEVPTEPDLNLVTLDTLARFHGASRLPLATAMYLGANIARAVAEFHDRGEVLGTLEANRIRCSHDGRVVIVSSPRTSVTSDPHFLSNSSFFLLFCPIFRFHFT